MEYLNLEFWRDPESVTIHNVLSPTTWPQEANSIAEELEAPLPSWVYKGPYPFLSSNTEMLAAELQKNVPEIYTKDTHPSASTHASDRLSGSFDAILYTTALLRSVARTECKYSCGPIWRTSILVSFVKTLFVSATTNTLAIEQPQYILARHPDFPYNPLLKFTRKTSVAAFLACQVLDHTPSARSPSLRDPTSAPGTQSSHSSYLSLEEQLLGEGLPKVQHRHDPMRSEADTPFISSHSSPSNSAENQREPLANVGPIDENPQPTEDSEPIDASASGSEPEHVSSPASGSGYEDDDDTSSADSEIDPCLNYHILHTASPADQPIFPIVCMDNSDDIFGLMASALYQRFSCSIHDPVVGLVFSPGSSFIKAIIGWLDGGNVAAGKLLRVHIASGDSSSDSASLGMFNPQEPLDAVRLAAFLLSLADRTDRLRQSVVEGASDFASNLLLWRSDCNEEPVEAVESEQEDLQLSVTRWADDVANAVLENSGSTLTPLSDKNAESTAARCPKARSATPSAEDDELTTSSADKAASTSAVGNETRRRRKNSKQVSIKTTSSQQSIRSAGGTLYNIPEDGVVDDRLGPLKDDVQTKDDGRFDDQKNTEVPSKMSFPSYAYEDKMAGDNREERLLFWLYARKAIISGFYDSEKNSGMPEPVRDYEDYTAFHWPKIWTTLDAMPPVDKSVEALKEALFKAAKERDTFAEANRVPEPEDLPESSEEFQHITSRLSIILQACLIAQKSHKTNEERRINEVQSRIAWDALIFAIFLSSDPEQTNPLVECDLNLPENDLVEILDHTDISLWRTQYRSKCIVPELAAANQYQMDLFDMWKSREVPNVPKTHLPSALKDIQQEIEQVDGHCDIRIPHIQSAALKASNAEINEKSKLEPSEGTCDTICTVFDPDFFGAFAEDDIVEHHRFVNTTSPKPRQQSHHHTLTVPGCSQAIYPSLLETTKNDARVPGIIKSGLSISLSSKKDKGRHKLGLHAPLLTAAYKRITVETGRERVGVNKNRMYTVGGSKFLATLGIYDCPVFGLVTDGTEGVVTCTFTSKLQTGKSHHLIQDVTKVVELNARMFDIATPLGAFHSSTFLCMLVYRHAKNMRGHLGAVREQFHEKIRVEDDTLRWTKASRDPPKQSNTTSSESREAEVAIS